MEKLPAVSPCGAKLGYITADRARQMIRQRQAIGKGSKKRIDYVVILHAIVRDSIPVGALRTMYDDDLGHGLHLLSLKRVDAHGNLHKWHPRLTFQDARAGRTVPEEVAIERAEQRRLARHSAA